MILVEQWPQYYGSLTRALLVEELVPKGLCLNPAGEWAAQATLKNHYLRQSGASKNWRHASQAAYDQRAQQARTGARGTGTAGTPDPKDESGTQAPPPSETSVPYERTRAPEPEPSRQRTIAELCSTKDFVEWVTAVADFQALVEPEVHGVLQAAEFGAVWRSRMETLAKTPMIMCDLPRVPLRDKKVSWETLLTGKVVISEEGRLTIATTTKFRNQAGQVVREEEHVPPRATLRVGSTLFSSTPFACHSSALRAGLPDDLRRCCEASPQLHPLRHTLRYGPLRRGWSHPQTYSQRNGLPKVPRGHRP